jgi:hypothetical protein
MDYTSLEAGVARGALLLPSLKDEHPALAGRSGEAIAADPAGPVARQRLGLVAR